MYIAPNSTVKLLKNVPLDNTYEHTVYFDTKAHQHTWFEGYLKTGMTFSKQYYQRHSRDYIKLETLADNVYDCNYLMFQNTSYGTKWFYAFITNVEYINDNVTLIQYEIDDMQTWHFDYTLKDCFVEREHSIDDIIGENLIPENFDIGDHLVVDTERFIGKDRLGFYSNLDICVAAPFNETYGDYAGGKVTNGYSGLYYNMFHGANAEADAAAFISGAGLKKDEIVNVFYCFGGLCERTGVQSVVPTETNITLTRTAPQTFGAFGRYTPKNMKLYTYPYCYLRVKDGFGNYSEYKYEYFDGAIQFKLTGDLSPNPSVICIPQNYMGETDNYSECFTLTGFPQCAWNSDAYIAWLAQTGIRVYSDVVGGVVEGGLNAVGNDKGLLANIGEGVDRNLNGEVTSILREGLTVKANRRQVGGTQGSMLAIAADMLFIDAEQMQIREEFARIIDDYFTKFGYPVKRVKQPQYTNRPYWNYIKTRGCMAVGSVPADALRHICRIFDNGITWWSRTATIGDYMNQDNSPAI